MTLDRDIRFTPEQITTTQKALRQRRDQLVRSIDKAEASRAAGLKIQYGTHSRNIEERNRISLILDNLEVARKQIGHQIASRLSA